MNFGRCYIHSPLLQKNFVLKILDFYLFQRNTGNLSTYHPSAPKLLPLVRVHPIKPLPEGWTCP